MRDLEQIFYYKKIIIYWLSRIKSVPSPPIVQRNFQIISFAWISEGQGKPPGAKTLVLKSSALSTWLSAIIEC